MTATKKEYKYTFSVEFESNEDEDEPESIIIEGLCEADAKALYLNAKTALKNKEEYFELPEMKQYDSDAEAMSIFYPEYVHIVDVKKVYYEKPSDEDDE